MANYFERLASLGRLISFDLRGYGMSDPIPNDDFGLDDQVADLICVLDAVGSERAVLLGAGLAGPLMIRTAVTVPDRVQGLVLSGTYTRLERSDDYPIGASAESLDASLDWLRTNWGSGVTIDLFAPSLADDPELPRALGTLRATRGQPRSAGPGRRHSPIGRRPQRLGPARRPHAGHPRDRRSPGQHRARPIPRRAHRRRRVLRNRRHRRVDNGRRFRVAHAPHQRAPGERRHRTPTASRLHSSPRCSTSTSSDRPTRRFASATPSGVRRLTRFDTRFANRSNCSMATRSAPAATTSSSHSQDRPTQFVAHR